MEWYHKIPAQGPAELAISSRGWRGNRDAHCGIQPIYRWQLREHPGCEGLTL